MLNLLKIQHFECFKIFVCSLFFVLYFSSANAQIDNNRFRVNLNSLDMGPCGGANDAPSRVAVFAKNNTVNNFEIAFDFPDGVTYIPGSERITFQQGSLDFVLSVVDMSNLNAPVFRLERPGNVNWEVADLVRFRFDKTASCDAVQFSYAGGLFKDAHTITYNDSSGPQTASDTDPTINSYELQRAFLAVLNYSDVNSSVGSNITRNLNIDNTGNGNIARFVHNVNFGAGLSGYSLSFNGTPLTPSTISGNNLTYIINLSQAPFAGNVGDGDSVFENESITLTESFAVDNCSDTNVSHQPTWGCSTTEICQALTPVVGQVLLNTEVPNLTINEIGSTPFVDFATTNTYQIRLTNNGVSGNALNIHFNTGFGLGGVSITTNTNNGLYGNDFPSNLGKQLVNFRIGSTAVTPVILPNNRNTGVGAGSYLIPPDTFTTDPDGFGTGFEDLDGDGFFDDLAPGASIDLFYELILSPRNAGCDNTRDNFVRASGIHTDAYSANQCGVFTNTARVRTHFSVLTRRIAEITSPTDVFTATTFNVGIRSRMSNETTGRIRCNGIELFSNETSTTMTTTLTVPNGILLDGAPAGFTQISPTEIQYTTDQLDSGDPRFLNLLVDFPLVLDCNVYTGPQNLALSYRTRFESPCFSEDIHCGTIDGVRTQCPSTCNGVVINSFDAERQSLGWTDNSMAINITPDPNIHNLDTYMRNDEMRLQTSATLNNVNPDNLFFDLFYTTQNAQAGGANILEFLDGSITINDVSSGIQSTAITASDITVTSSGLDHRLRIDLSSYTNIISTTYTYGEPQGTGPAEADVISLALNFRFSDFMLERSLLELENFSGRFMYNDTSGNPITCNTIGDRVFYFKPTVTATRRTTVNVRDCRQGIFEFYLGVNSIDGVDPFPDEYRRASSWSSISFDIPSGVNLSGFSQNLFFPNGNNNFNLIQSGNTITLTPTSNFRYPDINSNQSPRFQIGVMASAETPLTDIVNYTFNATAYPDSSVPLALDNSNTINFAYEVPEHTISSISPVVVANNVGATFEIDLCLDSSTDIDYNWLKISNGSTINITNAYEVTGTGNTALNFTTIAGETFIEVGQLVQGGNTCKKIRFDVDYTECNPLDFTIENSWDCSGYPSDFTAATYLNPYTLRLEPREAVLQFAILDEPTGPVDTCSDFDIELEVRNAGNGNLIQPTIDIDIPGDATSLTINQIFMEYPRGTAPELVTFSQIGNTVTVNMIDDTDAAASNGLMGALMANNLDDQIALLRIDLSVACSFTSSSAITFEANGSNPCTSPAFGDGSRLSTNPIIVNGAEPFYDAVSTLSVPSANTFTGCTTETISVESTIVGGPTGTTDFARIILPDGLQYEPGSFVATTTNVAAFNSVTVVGNHEEVLLNMPSGVNNGELVGYSIDVTPRNDVNTCTPNARIEIQNFVTLNSLSCGGVSCGTTDVPVGNTFEDIIITKPELIESVLTSNSDYTTDGGGNYEYHIEFGIENTGSVDITSGFVYDVYCADASGVRTGASIYNGTVSQSILAGNAISENITFTTSNFCGANGNLIVEFVPSSTNCHCDVLSIPLSSEPEVADLEVTSAVNPTTVNVGDTVTFTIDVLNNGPFEAENVLIENSVPAGYTVTGINDGGTQTGNTIIWPQFNILSSNTSTFSFTATVNSPVGTTDEFDNVTQVVAVAQDDNDSMPNNYNGTPLEDDEAVVSAILMSADLSLRMQLSPGSLPNPQVGETGTMEIVLTNNGPDSASNVAIENIIPVGFNLDNSTISNGGAPSGSNIVWNIASITSGESITLSFDFTINTPSNTIAEYTNAAQVTASDQFDPNSTPNNYTGTPVEDDEASYQVNTEPTVDIAVTKVADKTESYFEDTVIFTVSVENIGIDQATNISIDELLPNGFQLESVTASVGTYDEVLGAWGIDVLNPTETAELILNTIVLEGSDYTNTASLAFVDQVDIDPNNDSDSVTINVTQEECLTVFNEFSPNGDGANEVFFIECIEEYPNNTIQVFNRWGTKVFEQQNYDNTWDGTSKGRATINSNEKLPVGTYFYTLELGDGQTAPKSGWLYITR